jgi:hypothetical protein
MDGSEELGVSKEGTQDDASEQLEYSVKGMWYGFLM